MIDLVKTYKTMYSFIRRFIYFASVKKNFFEIFFKKSLKNKQST